MTQCDPPFEKSWLRPCQCVTSLALLFGCSQLTVLFIHVVCNHSNEKYSADYIVSSDIVYHAFSNSLLIHQAKTKEITIVREVWIPDLN